MDWLTYSGGTDRPNLKWPQMANFPTWIPDYDSHSLALLNLFIFDASICYTMVFPPLGNSDLVIVSVSIEFSSNSKWDAQFHHIACDYFCTYWEGLVIIWEMFHG